MPRGVYDHKPQSEETKAKKSVSLMNHIVAKETREKIRLAHVGTHHSEETKAKISTTLTGITRSKETRAKIGDAKRGSNSASKRPEVRTKMGDAKRGEKNPAKRPEVRAKLKAKGIERWQDPEYREKQIEAIFKGLKLLPNKPEKFITKLLDKLFSGEWKYTGAGKEKKYRIGGKAPDFTNINGQKKIIEFYGDYWHKDNNPQDRIDLFAKYGFRTLVIWERELKDPNSLVEKICRFHSAKS